MELLELLYHPTEGRSWSFPLPSHALAVKQARILISTALADWGLVVLEENAHLIGSELVTNALKHGENKDFRLDLVKQGNNLLIQVTDHSFGTPILRNPENSDDGGRGLVLVEVLAESWSVHYNSDETKTVWATVTK